MDTPSQSTSSYGMKKEHKFQRIIPFDSINILYVHDDAHKNKRKLALRLLSGFITGFQLCTRPQARSAMNGAVVKQMPAELAYIRHWDELITGREGEKNRTQPTNPTTPE